MGRLHQEAGGRLGGNGDEAGGVWQISGSPLAIPGAVTAFAYVSSQSASALGWNGGNGFNNTGALSIEPICSGELTLEQALNYAHSRGGRLPTVAEVQGGAVAGTGCGYDAEQIWTCDAPAGDQTQHYVNQGDGSGSSSLRSNTSTAKVRVLADSDTGRADPVLLDDQFIYDWLQANGYI